MSGATGRPRRLPTGPWRGLLTHAIALMDDIAARGIADPHWTLGGGTVLMLRHGHRHSKDIDVFVPDRQYLGYLTPRLSDLADRLVDDYVESPTHVKLLLPEGEIDFVVSVPLTRHPFDVWRLQGRAVRVETAAEIVAKKLWHRGDTATARDLFDLSMVIEREPQALLAAARWLVRHREAFLAQLSSRERVLQAQFEAIDALSYRPSWKEAVDRASAFLGGLPEPHERP